ncbi:MAG: isoaspartyl peptidase/L-asparaginase [Candidatus Thalassarchaeaceae archaeon]
MRRMAIIAHGGAGADPAKTANIQSAVDAGGRSLAQGASALEVAVMVCAALEDDPAFNAGTGSVTRQDGSVLVDASVQTGDGQMGFVVSMPETPNPVRVAAALIDEGVNGLAGMGARAWADERGFPRADVIPRPPDDAKSGDTVGAIALDSQGRIAVATSTGGCSDRPPGRVGDVPLPGCGFWAESGIAVAATGIGEAITREMLCFRVHNQISRKDKTMPEAFKSAISTRFDEETDVGLIGINEAGATHAHSNTNMPWASWTSD